MRACQTALTCQIVLIFYALFKLDYNCLSCNIMYLARIYEKTYIGTILCICLCVHACRGLLALRVGDGEAIPLVFCLVFKEYLIHVS